MALPNFDTDGELTGRTAIVTGASRGIGEAVAHRLAGAGCAVVLTSRVQAESQAVADAILAKGGRAKALEADQGDAADWDRVVGTAESEFGGLDILVLNAGIVDSGFIETQPLEAFRAVNRVNLKGSFLGLKAGVAAMKRGGRGGSAVLVSSIVGKIGVPGEGAYTAAKDGLRLMAKAAALEFGGDRIRVNSLHPGFVRTRMSAPFDEAMFKNLIPLGRFGEPPELADAVLFLASDRSKFMTGAELVVDGGWIAQ